MAAEKNENQTLELKLAEKLEKAATEDKGLWGGVKDEIFGEGDKVLSQEECLAILQQEKADLEKFPSRAKHVLAIDEKKFRLYDISTGECWIPYIDETIHPPRTIAAKIHTDDKGEPQPATWNSPWKFRELFYGRVQGLSNYGINNKVYDSDIITGTYASGNRTIYFPIETKAGNFRKERDEFIKNTLLPTPENSKSRADNFQRYVEEFNKLSKDEKFEAVSRAKALPSDTKEKLSKFLTTLQLTGSPETYSIGQKYFAVKKLLENDIDNTTLHDIARNNPADFDKGAVFDKFLTDIKSPKQPANAVAPAAAVKAPDTAAIFAAAEKKRISEEKNKESKNIKDESKPAAIFQFFKDHSTLASVISGGTALLVAVLAGRGIGASTGIPFAGTLGGWIGTAVGVCVACAIALPAIKEGLFGLGGKAVADLGKSGDKKTVSIEPDKSQNIGVDAPVPKLVTAIDTKAVIDSASSVMTPADEQAAAVVLAQVNMARDRSSFKKESLLDKVQGSAASKIIDSRETVSGRVV